MKRKLLWILLGLLALGMLLPIWIAVTGAFSSQWELTENLRPVLDNGQGLAGWTLVPKSPTLRALVEVLLDSPGFFGIPLQSRQESFWDSACLRSRLPGRWPSSGCPGAWAISIWC